MRYLKLYEAFVSRGISKTLDFLSKKVSKYDSERFLNDLKTFMTKVDYPIDKLSDEFIKYLPSKKALELKSDNLVTNESGIWALKYWFSLEDGYLGYTSTGNLRDYDIYVGKRTVRGKSTTIRSEERFSPRELEIIKEEITETGEIWCVTDYSKLKTGDVVIGLIDHKLTFAQIYVDQEDNYRTYAIQDVADGSVPDNQDWRNYRRFGNRSWWLWDLNEMGYDHSKLHFFRPSSAPLTYISNPFKKDDSDETQKTENPMNWNLPLDRGFTQVEWYKTSYSIESPDKVERADFALVLMYDDLLNPENDTPEYVPVSDIKKSREESKSGAVALMSDSEIKKLNYNNYVKKMIGVYGISLDSNQQELVSLQRIFNSFLCGQYILFSITTNYPNMSNVTDFERRVRQLVVSEEADAQLNFDRVRRQFEQNKEESKKYNLRFAGSYSRILKEGNEETIRIFTKLLSVSKNMYNSINSKNITTLDDLRILKSKLSSIREFMQDTHEDFSKGMKVIIENSHYNDSDVSRGIEYMNDENRVKLDSDIKTIELVEKYVNQILS